MKKGAIAPFFYYLKFLVASESSIAWIRITEV